MNKLKIAVLDNGADEKILALCGLPDIIQQNKGNISDEEDLFLHGTNCAMIIGLNCADAELYSYKLLDNTGKGNVDDLKSAFDWCLMNNIRLVNLSFGTTHFKDKGIIRQLVNQYANKGLIIIAATANSGYTAFPASFSNVIGVKAKDTFNIDAEGLRDKGVDFAAPSEHKIWFGGNDITLQKSNSYAAPYVTAMAGRLMMEQSWINNVWQIKKHLYQKFRGKCVQYIPDWIEKGWIAGKVLKSKAEVYFEVAAKEEADTVILYDKNEFNEYREKHIVYLGNEIAEQPDTQGFFWSRRNRKEQILCSRIKKENINIPVILLKSGKEQDQIWWLTELRKSFEAEGYNAYAISTEQESVLYDLEYIPFAVDENISNKIGDFLYWQTYYNQSDLIICHRDHIYSQCAQESGIFGICPKTVCFANLPLSPCCISKLIVCHRKICRNQFLFYFIGKIIRHVILCRLPRTPILIQTDIPDKIQTDACRIGCFFPDHILIRI